jgi:hypothetical protein
MATPIKTVVTRNCPKCCGFRTCTPEGRIFVASGDPDFSRIETCTRCNGRGIVSDNNPLTGKGPTNVQTTK